MSVLISLFVLAFASGIFVLLSQLPDVLQNIAPYFPLYRLAQLAWNPVGAQTGSIEEALWLLLFSRLAVFGLVIFASRRYEQLPFG